MSRNEKNKSAGSMADKKWFVVMAAVIVCFAFSPPQACAETWLERQKLLASDGNAQDFFGHSVSICGDYAIVGAPQDNDKGIFSGSAYIFKRDGASWSEQQKLTASDGATGDSFGGSVSISADWAIVGAQQDDDKGSGSGSAYIFKRNGANWVQQQKLTASDGAVDDRFGGSVFSSGDLAIVGAHHDDGIKGCAYIFKWNGASWSEQQKLTASDGAVWDKFGSSVSISADWAIVGAHEDDDRGSESGSAYIFKRDGANWVQQQKLTASDGAEYGYFGASVSISGDLAIVGTNRGPAYIFKREDESWSEQQKLTASDGDPYDQFGISVSISGDFAVVGASADDDKGIESGSAYIFRRDGTSWSEQQKLIASDGAAEEYFGGSVCISGDFAVVGAYRDDDKGPGSGSAYVFRFCPRADLDDNCKVDFADLAIFADWWLYGSD